MPSTTPPQPPTAIRVAVVEDDPPFQLAFVQALQAAPDMTLAWVAGTRAEALAMLRGPDVDVLLVDLGLPDGSGIDVIRAAQSAWPACAAMVATAFGDEAHVLASIEAGAAGYLLKDASALEVVREIRTLQNGGSPISPLIARRVLHRLRAVTPAPAAPETPSTLSQRETQVLELPAKGFLGLEPLPISEAWFGWITVSKSSPIKTQCDASKRAKPGAPERSSIRWPGTRPRYFMARFLASRACMSLSTICCCSSGGRLTNACSLAVFEA